MPISILELNMFSVFRMIQQIHALRVKIKKRVIDILKSEFFFRLVQSPLSKFGALILLIVFSLAIFGPFFTPYDPYKVDPDSQLIPPSREHLFGTDYYGRDLLSRTMAGGQNSLLIGFVCKQALG